MLEMITDLVVAAAIAAGLAVGGIVVAVIVVVVFGTAIVHGTTVCVYHIAEKINTRTPLIKEREYG